MHSYHSCTHHHINNDPNNICPQQRLVDRRVCVWVVANDIPADTETSKWGSSGGLHQRAKTIRGKKKTKQQLTELLSSLWLQKASIFVVHVTEALGINYSSVLTTQTARTFMVWMSDLRPVCNSVITIKSTYLSEITDIFRELFLKWLNTPIDQFFEQNLNAAGFKWFIWSGVSA